MHRIIVRLGGLFVLYTTPLHNPNKSVPQPSVLFNFTDMEENVRFSAAIDTFTNLPTSLNVSPQSLC